MSYVIIRMSFQTILCINRGAINGKMYACYTECKKLNWFVLAFNFAIILKHKFLKQRVFLFATTKNGLKSYFEVMGGKIGLF